MKKILILLTVTASLMFATDVANITKESTKKVMKNKQNPPFLILGKMPHLAGMVKGHWDNPSLGLTDIQKQKLTAVRSSTMGDVMRLKKEISPLEKEVASEAMAGKSPKDLKEKVDKIAELKAEATMVHIRCIYETKNILDPKQLEYLLENK